MYYTSKNYLEKQKMRVVIKCKFCEGFFTNDSKMVGHNVHLQNCCNGYASKPYCYFCSKRHHFTCNNVVGYCMTCNKILVVRNGICDEKLIESNMIMSDNECNIHHSQVRYFKCWYCSTYHCSNECQNTVRNCKFCDGVMVKNLNKCDLYVINKIKAKIPHEVNDCKNFYKKDESFESTISMPSSYKKTMDTTQTKKILKDIYDKKKVTQFTFHQKKDIIHITSDDEEYEQDYYSKKRRIENNLTYEQARRFIKNILENQ